MDLSELAERVSAAAAEAMAPSPPVGSKPRVWPTDLLGENGWSLPWQPPARCGVLRRNRPVGALKRLSSAH
jgi:hypothetical protein